MTVVVLSNVESVARDDIRYFVGAAVFNEPYTVPAKSEFAEEMIEMNPLVGVYSFGPNFQVSVALTGGRLLARANEGAYSELVYSGEGRWFSRMLYADVCFEKNSEGAVDQLIWGCSDGAPIGRRIESLQNLE